MEFSLDLQQAVFVAGMAFISGVLSKSFLYVPLAMAMIFPEYVVTASFVGMIVTLFLGSVTIFTKAGR